MRTHVATSTEGEAQSKGRVGLAVTRKQTDTPSPPIYHPLAFFSLRSYKVDHRHESPQSPLH